jgi:hypothetical protein
MPPAQAARLLDALAELGQPRNLTASRPVLREAALVAIDELGETVSRHCTRMLRSGGSATELSAAVSELSGLVDVLRSIDQSGRP